MQKQIIGTAEENHGHTSRYIISAGEIRSRGGHNKDL